MHCLIQPLAIEETEDLAEVSEEEREAWWKRQVALDDRMKQLVDTLQVIRNV